MKYKAVFALLTVALAAASAPACPVCDSDTGKEVRAGLFGADFVPNLLAVALPFPVFLGITALIYYGPPRGKDKR